LRLNKFVKFLFKSYKTEILSPEKIHK